MLEAMNRVLIAAADADAVGAAWERLLDAEPAGCAARPALGAQAHCWRLGNGWLEVLTPERDGIVAQAVAARGPHLFAGGFTTTDPDAFAAHLERRGVTSVRDGERLMIDASGSGVQGLRLMVEAHQPEPAVGLIDRFYELTDLVTDAERETARLADVLGLDASRFEPIESRDYGYRGHLTLFDRSRLDRLEVITPTREDTTMYRFFRRIDGGLYMAFAETDQLSEIERRARALEVGHTAVPAPPEQGAGPHQLFLHPSALGGMMLGLSRRTYAWTWSGHPERVVSV